MPKFRSPSYPSITLSEALTLVDTTLKYLGSPDEVLADRKAVSLALGYASLNGRVLGSVSALLKYGLLEKVDTGYRVTDSGFSLSRAISTESKTYNPMKYIALRSALEGVKASKHITDKYGWGVLPINTLHDELVSQGFTNTGLLGFSRIHNDNMMYLLSTKDNSVLNKPDKEEPKKHKPLSVRIKTDNADIRPEVGSYWQHRNGIMYRIEEPSNVNGNTESYPECVNYRNLYNNKLWTRPLHDWHRSMTLVNKENAAQMLEALTSIVELATQEEWDAGTDVTRKVIPT